ncbi:MAG: hypothetical protein AAF449_10240, partial [Myxococcota bacterium]
MAPWVRWIAVAGLFGCSPDIRLAPPIPADTQVALWAVDRTDEWRIDVSTIDPETPWRFADSVDEGTPVAVLAYRASLFTLGMTTGPQTSIETTSARTRPLPVADALLYTEVGRGDWQTLTELPEGLDGFRIPTVDAETCIDAGGCMSNATSSALCLLPCDETAPAPPAEAEAPLFTPCPSGWAERTIESTSIATCVPADAQDCPSASFQSASAASCRPLAGGCGLPFAPPPSGPVVYIDPSAPPGGDGSREAPYADLSAVLSQGPSVTAMLAAGTYPAAPLRDGLMLIGTCAEEVRIGAAGTSVRLAAGAAAVRQATLVGTVVADGGTLGLEDVDIEGGGAPALQVRGATVQLQNSQLQSTGIGALVESSGRLVATGVGMKAREGFSIQLGGAADLEDVRISGAERAIQVSAGSNLTARTLVVENGGRGDVCIHGLYFVHG